VHCLDESQYRLPVQVSSVFGVHGWQLPPRQSRLPLQVMTDGAQPPFPLHLPSPFSSVLLAHPDAPQIVSPPYCSHPPRPSQFPLLPQVPGMGGQSVADIVRAGIGWQAPVVHW
jgi:hypothetical protein